MNTENKRPEPAGLPAEVAMDLRRRAEMTAAGKTGHVPDVPEDISPEAMRRMLHELQVREIELLMQNEELRRAQSALEAANDRYFSFYDLAPVGFCTLSDKGLVLEANLTFASWIGEDRGDLVNAPLTRFILPEDQDTYYLHRRQLFETSEPQACELRLLCRDNTVMWASIDATALRSPHGEPMCRIVLTDITGRKRTEKALAEREAMYRLIFNAVPVAIFHYDNNSVVKTCNRKALSLFGLSEQQAFGMNLLETATDERVLHSVKTALAGTPSGFAGEYTSALTGKKMNIDSMNVPIFSDDGGVSGAIVVMADIEDKVKTEQALRESEKNLASMFNAISESVFLLDPQGVLLSVNDTTARRLGSTPDGMKGKIAYDFLPKEVADSRRVEIERVFRTGKEVHFEDIRFGRYMRHALYPVFDDDGQVTRLAVFSHDIHDLKIAEQALRESEEKARALLDSTNDPVVLLNREGILLDLNDAFAGWINKKEEEIVNKCIWELFPPEVSEFRKGIVEEIFSTGQPVILTEEANNRIFETRVYPVSGATGMVNRVAVFLRDVTEHKRAGDELRASHARLRELSKHLEVAREQERTRIAREIHDELGQVLTAITLETSWLAKKIPKGMNALKLRADAAADLAAGAIQSVRKIIAELRPALLTDLGLAEAIKWQAGEYRKRTGIQCDVSIDSKGMDVTDEISTAVFRIFQESFTNVIRHSKATEMSVSLKEVDGEIEIIIEDNGIGMEGYRRTEDSFGIMGMRERAEALGGKLDISGMPGKGTVVVARIPVSGNPMG